MTIKQFLTIIGFGTLLCWSALGVVVWNIDPFEASTLSLSFFYVSAFLASAGTIMTVLYGIYHFFGDVQVPVFRYVKKSMHQGMLAAGVLTGLLFLQGHRLLNVWTIVFIVLLITFFVSLTFSQRTTRRV